MPCLEDIIDIVVDAQKSSNSVVDVKAPTLAFLPLLEFEGTMRKNRPKFNTGALIHA